MEVDSVGGAPAVIADGPVKGQGAGGVMLSLSDSWMSQSSSSASVIVATDDLVATRICVTVVSCSDLWVAAAGGGGLSFSTEEELPTVGAGVACSSGVTVIAAPAAVVGGDVEGGGRAALSAVAEGKSNKRAIIIASACCSVSSLRRLPRFLLAQVPAIWKGPRHSWLSKVVNCLMWTSSIF